MKRSAGFPVYLFARLWPIAVILFSACEWLPEVRDAGDVQVEVRDSAGVRIVEHGRVEDLRSGWRVGPEPLLLIGWEGQPRFRSLAAGAVLAEGRYAVGDSRAGEVWILSEDEGVVGSVVLSGNGLREYGNITSIEVLPPDSIVVYDRRFLHPRSQRVFVLHGTDFVRTKPLPPVTVSWRGGLGSGYAIHSLGGVTAERELLMVQSGVTRVITEGWAEGNLVRVGPDWETVDAVFEHDSHYVGDGPPFRGVGIPIVAGERFVYGRSDIPQLTFVSASGAVDQITRWEQDAVEVDAATWDEFVSVELSRYDERGSARREKAEAHLEEARADAIGTDLPLFGGPVGDREGGVLGDSEGNVWIGEFTFRGRPRTRYRVVSADGRFVGSVTLPRGLEVLDISGTRLLGVLRNDLDEPAVAVYAIEK